MIILRLAIEFLVAFVATVAFAMLFQMPRAQYAWCGLTGAAGWLIYEMALLWQPSTVIASLFASIVLTFLTRAFSVVRRCPSTIFLISGIFPLVPGAGIYYTAYNFFMGDNAAAGIQGAETIKIALAIALGIVFVMSLPNGFLRPFTPKKSP